MTAREEHQTLGLSPYFALKYGLSSLTLPELKSESP